MVVGFHDHTRLTMLLQGNSMNSRYLKVIIIVVIDCLKLSGNVVCCS